MQVSDKCRFPINAGVLQHRKTANRQRLELIHHVVLIYEVMKWESMIKFPLWTCIFDFAARGKLDGV